MKWWNISIGMKYLTTIISQRRYNCIQCKCCVISNVCKYPICKWLIQILLNTSHVQRRSLMSKYDKLDLQYLTIQIKIILYKQTNPEISCKYLGSERVQVWCGIKTLQTPWARCGVIQYIITQYFPVLSYIYRKSMVY